MAKVWVKILIVINKCDFIYKHEYRILFHQFVPQRNQSMIAPLIGVKEPKNCLQVLNLDARRVS